MPVYKFDSPIAFAKECAKIPSSSRMTDDSMAKSWTGETFKESLDQAIYGTKNQELLEKAQSLMDQLYEEIDIPYPTWQSSMAGAYPSVPDYLMNSPEPMRMKTPEENSRNPITIFYVTTSSGGHSWEDLLKRGICTLALAQVLQKVRPVNLKLVATLDGASSDNCTLMEINVDLNNLSLSHAAYVIASTGFDRNLTHTYAAHHNGFTGHWAWKSFPSDEKYWTNLRHYLKISEEDLLIKGAFLTDNLMVDDPIKWCKQQINRYKDKLHADQDWEDLPQESEEDFQKRNSQKFR